MSYKAYAERITQQIFEGDQAFFLESGVDMESAVPFEKHGIYGGIRYDVHSESRIGSLKILTENNGITVLEITLEASDLYTVRVTKPVAAIEYANVISLTTQKPVTISATEDVVTVERVFAYDLMEVLWGLFYRKI